MKQSDNINNNSTPFTVADRQLIQKTAELMQAVYDCLFGNPDHPHNGLFHLCNLNTRFRRNMTRLMWVLIPVILSIIFTLVTMKV